MFIKVGCHGFIMSVNMEKVTKFCSKILYYEINIKV